MRAYYTSLNNPFYSVESSIIKQLSIFICQCFFFLFMSKMGKIKLTSKQCKQFIELSLFRTLYHYFKHGFQNFNPRNCGYFSLEFQIE